MDSQEMKNRYTNPDFFVLTDGCSVVTWGSHKLLTHLTEAQDKANKLTYLRLNFSLTVSRLRNRKDIKGEKEESKTSGVRLQMSNKSTIWKLQSYERWKNVWSCEDKMHLGVAATTL